ncbi:MAG: deoxyribonuclease V [Dehalococcoidales bacterium]|nr:deoxyribonuclease V [Dehalococcoidales bacterium]
MKIRELHRWDVSPTEAVKIQRTLAAQVSRRNELSKPRYIAGVDISSGRAIDTATAAVVVLSYPELVLVDSSVIQIETTFPYVPGLLSFRETPLVIKAYEKLKKEPDLILVDGQGIAHPRRMGFASHLGLVLDKPTIGCAKSLLTGEHDELAEKAGSYTEIIDNGEVIGAVVRTADGVKPVYVSIGHRVDLPAAIHWALACCREYRIPKPLRLAHQAAYSSLKSGKIT